MRFKWIHLLLLIVFAFGLVAMPRFLWADTRTKVVFWAALDGEKEAKCAELVEKYNKESKVGTTIEFVNFPSRSALREELEHTQSPPDLALIDTLWQRSLIDRHAIVPAEELMDQMGSMIKVVYKMDTFPKVWMRALYSGKAWTVPVFAESYAITYDKALFTNKGIGKAPQTWQEVVASGRKLTSPKDKQWGFVIPPNLSVEELAEIWVALLEEHGGVLVDPKTRKIVANSKEGKQALQLMVDMIHKHKISPSHETSGAISSAMMLGTPEDVQRMQSRGVAFGVAPWPKSKKRVNNLRVEAIAIMKTTPERQKQAWRFTNWFTEYEVAKDLAFSTYSAPVNKQVWLSPDYLQFLKAQRPWMQVYIDQFQTASVCCDAAEYERMLTILGTHILSALQNKRSPSDALDSAVSEMKGIIARGSDGIRG
ncbi:MAG: extracellular solute-binding protein [Armatimonadetes bacterium]|nr:extracellular solute-binding protein [Armatimonadota bacterium]